MIIFEFSRDNSLMEGHLRVRILLKQGYQKYQVFLKSASIYRFKLARTRPWKQITFLSCFQAYESPLP